MSKVEDEPLQTAVDKAVDYLKGDKPKMETMIERVAKAIAVADNYIWGEHTHKTTIIHYTNLAKAAIAAMREPTEEMCLKSGIPVHTAGLIWKDMIDAALRE